MQVRVFDTAITQTSAVNSKNNTWSVANMLKKEFDISYFTDVFWIKYHKYWKTGGWGANAAISPVQISFS